MVGWLAVVALSSDDCLLAGDDNVPIKIFHIYGWEVNPHPVAFTLTRKLVTLHHDRPEVLFSVIIFFRYAFFA